MIAAFHIAIAMKPIEGTFVDNALKHGVAGLNIDACRIGQFTSNTPSGFDRLNKRQAELGYRPGEYQKGVPALPQTQGRFPANLILSHSPECKCVGTKKVKGSFIEKPCPNPEIRGHKWGTMQGNRGARGHGDRDGTETTQDWKCTDGCAVKLLGEQSGMLKSGKPGVRRKPHETDCMSGRLGLTGKQEEGYADSGTASRFFHAVTEFQIEEEGEDG
jgi:site-specific DNA-methyltransferase (adenine-specific)